MNIKPYKKGDKGTICLMLQKNIPNPKEDYIDGNCPTCNSKVWITPQAQNLAKVSPELNSKCTECSLKQG